MFYLAGIVITFFLAILLTGKRNKTTADKILFAWLCIIGFHLLLYYLFITGIIFNYTGLLGFHVPYPLLHGPFLFLYTSALTGQGSKNRFVWMFHFLPVAVFIVALIPFFNLSPAEKINVYQNKGAGYEGLMKICFYSIILSGIAYVTASLILLRRYRKSIEDEFSNTEKINLLWLRYLIYGIAVIWISIFASSDTVLFGTVVLFVFFLGFFGIRQVGIFTTAIPPVNAIPTASTVKILTESTVPSYKENLQDDRADQSESVSFAPKVRYVKSGLDGERAEVIYNRLQEHMNKDKLFTDPELTLAGLAKVLEVHPNHLSQVINSYEGKNFYHFINQHRVEEFKRLAPLPDNRNYTLLSLAFECGFNSKTSFNRNFKIATGVAPSEYLQQMNISLK